MLRRPRLDGPLFGVPLLIVEGDDDYRIWSQIPRHHVANFSVIPANGDEIKKYQKALERIMSTLRESDGAPIGYALLDSDKALPESNPDNPQQHIQFLRMECHEAENLFLTDEVLADLGIDWDRAKLAIVERARDFGNKEELLEDAATWDRKSQDIKRVIEELSVVLDEKSVHWTQRVGRVLGRARPVGQLADFLGESVVNSLWGTR